MANLSPTVSSIRNKKEWGTQAGVSGITSFFIFYGQRFKADPCTKDITTCCLIMMQVGSGVS